MFSKLMLIINSSKNHCEKKFYVSPFMDLSSEYFFKVLEPKNKLSVIIDQRDQKGNFCMHLKMEQGLNYLQKTYFFPI